MVQLKAHEKFFVSLAHTDEDVGFTLEALRSAIDALGRLSAAARAHPT